MSRRGGYFDNLIRRHNNAEQMSYVGEWSDSLRTLIKADHFRMLYELTTTRFQWLNLPETMTHRYMEKTLADQGVVIFFKDKDSHTGKFWCLQGHGTGQLNPNGEWSNYLITAPHWTGPREFTSDEAVAIYSNPTRTPDLLRIHLYAQRLAEIDTTFDVNTRTVRRTRVILADQDRRLTTKHILDAIDRGDAAVEVTEDFRNQDFQVVDFGGSAQQLVDIHIAKLRIMGEAMTALGIDNANTDKKERQVVDEANANNAQVEATRQGPLDCREDAVRLINHRWPELNVEVRFRNFTVDTADSKSPEESTMEPTEGDSE